MSRETTGIAAGDDPVHHHHHRALQEILEHLRKTFGQVTHQATPIVAEAVDTVLHKAVDIAEYSLSHLLDSALRATPRDLR